MEQSAALHTAPQQRKVHDVQFVNEGSMLSIFPAALLQRTPEISKMLLTGSIDTFQQLCIKSFSCSVAVPHTELISTRIVIGTLDAAEDEEWVLRASGALIVPHGGIGIRRGRIGESTQGSLPGVGYGMSDIAQIPLAEGAYQVQIYAYLPSRLAREALVAQREPLGRWFRNTRASNPIPAWLLQCCVGNPALDPKNEAYWGEIESELNRRFGHCWDRKIAALARKYVHFIIQLTPSRGPRAQTHVADDLITSPWEWRRPLRCPLGIPTR